MPDLLQSVLVVTATSLVGSAAWVAGAIIALVACRRRKTAGVKLALIAFASLIAWQAVSSVVGVHLLPFLVDAGWSVKTAAATADWIFLLFRMGHAALVVLLALAFFRLIQENHAAGAYR